MNFRILQWAAALGVLAVILGAFGSHGLEGRIDLALYDAWQTANRYHFYHVLAMMALGLFAGEQRGAADAAIWAWAGGFLLFCGSLYAMAAANLWGLNWGFLGPITPLGGLAFIAGWIAFGLAVRARAKMEG